MHGKLARVLKGGLFVLCVFFFVDGIDVLCRVECRNSGKRSAGPLAVAVLGWMIFCWN